jgi:hypothetical protein
MDRLLPLVLLAGIALLAAPGPVVGADDHVTAVVFPPGSSATDTTAYLDPEARALVERAREARDREVQGIESYEARVWERVQVGLQGRVFRRERTLWEEERAARVRWEAGGDRVVQWEGAWRSSPVAGIRSDEDDETARTLARNLADLAGGSSPIFFQPGDDRILFGGGGWALHPLADTAAYHYRYRSGDTLTVTLFPDQRRISLVEVQVEPRRTDPRLVAGSLWFDQSSAELVRASYRPARPFILATDLDEDDDAPRFLRAIQAEIRQVTVDYSLQEMEWWLPYRFSLTVEVRAGQLIRIPAEIHWTMGEYRVNQAPESILLAEEAPEGWIRRERMRPSRAPGAAEGDSVRVVSFVPPADSLHLAPALTPPERRGRGEGRQAFEDAELETFRRALDRILPPTTVFAPRLMWGLEEGLLRYNRVEGLGLGVAGEMPLSRRVSARAEARIGIPELEPGGEIRVQRGGRERQASVAVYRRLEHTSDWENPFNLSSSLGTLLLGRDRGEYYRAHGAEVGVLRTGRATRTDVRFFAEAHRAASRSTDFTLRGLFSDDTLRANLVASEGTWYGAALATRGHLGTDPDRLRLFGGLRGEVAWGGEGAYQRVLASAGAVRPLGLLELGGEVGGGRGWGELPPQRQFFLGGPATVRGVHPGELVGEGFWFARGEVARGMPAVRLALFGDVGWAGEPGQWRSEPRTWSLGTGVSMLDGLLRVDLARRLGPTRAWRLHFYFDGIL